MLQDPNKEERICSSDADFWCNIHSCICNQVHGCLCNNSYIFWPFSNCSRHIPTVRGSNCHLMRQWRKTFPLKEGTKPSRSVDFASKWPPQKEVTNSLWRLIGVSRTLFPIFIMTNVTKGRVDSPSEKTSSSDDASPICHLLEEQSSPDKSKVHKNKITG